MQRTWVSCRPEEPFSHASQNGFTLLELLLVLALLALLIGLVAPAGQRALDSATERAAFRRIADSLRALPYEAFSRGQVVTVDEAVLQARLPDLPAGWELKLPRPLVFSPAGVSSGGEVTLKNSNGTAYRLLVAPITGELLASPGSDKYERAQHSAK